MGGAAKVVKRVTKAVATGGLSEISNLSKGPATPDINVPNPIMPAGAPTEDTARQQSEQENLLRKRRGRASTILTGSQGDNSTVNVGTKTLLG